MPKTLLADIRDGPDEEMESSRDSCQKDSCRECDRDFDFADNLTLAEVTAEDNSSRESYRRFLPDHTTTTGPALAEIPTGLYTGTGATLAKITAGLDKNSHGG